MPFVPVLTKEVIERIRETASMIRGFPDTIKDIAESEPWPSIEEVMKRLSPTKLDVEFAPVVDYVRRNWSPDHGLHLGTQVLKVTDAVRAFLETFRYWKQDKTETTVAFNRGEGANLLVLCMLVEEELMQWACDIEGRYQCPQDQSGSADPSVNTTESTDGFFDVPVLAERHGLPESKISALRKRLERWRNKNLTSSDWIEVEGRARNLDKYIYRESAVLHLISGSK